MRVVLLMGILLVSPPTRAAEPDATRGADFFAQGCGACHSVLPDKNMTGPSLAGVVGRKAGSLPSFPRYSSALKSSDVVWGDNTLDAWLTNPQGFIPGNRMVFPGLEDAQARADLIAFLKQGASIAQSLPDAGGMTGMGGGDVPNLKQASPASLVTLITYCGDTYDATTADGSTVQFWERNLRFKTDGSADGPKPGAPAIVGAGMVGDRASVIFAAPEEFGQFIKRKCSRQ